MRIPPADQIEIVRAEDPVLAPPPGRPLPDEMLITDLLREVAVSGRCYGIMRGGLPYWNRDANRWDTKPLRTVGDVRRVSDAEFLATPNLGRKTLKELREACGDTTPFNPKYRPTMVEALGAERAEIVIAMRSLASNLERLARLIEEAGRKGAL